MKQKKCVVDHFNGIFSSRPHSSFAPSLERTFLISTEAESILSATGKSPKEDKTKTF